MRRRAASLCGASLRDGIDAELLADMGEFFRVGQALSAIVVRSAAKPASVKNSRGKRWPVSRRINPRPMRPLVAGGSFGLPASGPARQVLSWKPSATLGSVEKNLSSSRRM